MERPPEKIAKVKQRLDEYELAAELHAHKSTSAYINKLKAIIAADDAAWEETLNAPHRLNPEPFQNCDCVECEKKRADKHSQELEQIVSTPFRDR